MERRNARVTTTHDPNGGGGDLLPPPSTEELADARKRFDQLILSVRQRPRLDVPDLASGALEEAEPEPDSEVATAEAERRADEIAVSEELVDLAYTYGFALPEDVRITISGDASTGVIVPEGTLQAIAHAIDDAQEMLTRFRMWRRVVHTQLAEQDIDRLEAALRAAERALWPHAYPDRSDDPPEHRDG
jgi:hypothetical protein